MSAVFHLLTRRYLDPAGAPDLRVRLEVWELEGRVVPAGGVATPAAPAVTTAHVDAEFPIRIPDNAFGLPPGLMALPLVASSPHLNGPPVVVFTDPLTGLEQYRFTPYDVSFRGGVRVEDGDVTGDGVPDLVCGTGPGGPAHIKVFDGATGTLATGALSSFFAFEPSFTGGVNVAVGDRNDDGYEDIAVGAGPDGGPRVRVFSGKDGSILRDFFPFDRSQRGGVSVAFADANADGKFGLVVGAGFGYPPIVKVYNAVTTGVYDDGEVLEQFTVYEPGVTGGVRVAAGDINRDGFVDIITGVRADGGPRVKVINGRTGEEMLNFFAFDPSFRGGVNLARIDLTADGVPEILVGTGPGGASHFRVFDAVTGDLLYDHSVFKLGVVNLGLNVAGH